eukprot:6463566-Amphidinium_carterae.1
MSPKHRSPLARAVLVLSLFSVPELICGRFLSSGHWKEAVQVLAQGEESGLQACQKSATSTLLACGKAPRTYWRQALSFIDRLPEHVVHNKRDTASPRDIPIQPQFSVQAPIIGLQGLGISVDYCVACNLKSLLEAPFWNACDNVCQPTVTAIALVEHI